MPERPWLDISLRLGSDTPVYPGDPAVLVAPLCTLEVGASHITSLSCNSHSGTHVDAPAHFVRGARTLAEIPLARWNGPAWVVSIAPQGEIEVEDLLLAWPDAGPVERLLLQTPNSECWDTATAGHTWQGLTLEAAEWLVSLDVKLVGIDALSIENDDGGIFPVHHTLLGNDCLIVEGLDLRGITPGPYELVCMPLRLEAPDGAPARVALRPWG